MPFLAVGAGTDPVLIELIVVLASAGLVAAIANRLRVPTVPAYLIAGIIVGPSGLDVLGQLMGSDEMEAAVQSVANISIVLLLFGIGLHLDIQALRGGAAKMIGAGVGCVVGCALLLVPALLAGGFSTSATVTGALALSLSSTAVVMSVLVKKRELHRVSGRLTLAILIVQDIAVVGMLLLLPTLAGIMGDTAAPAEEQGGSIMLELLIGLGVTLAIIVVGRWPIPWLLKRAAATSGSVGEILTVLSVAFALASAGATSAAGLSPELGAFLAGFLLSSTPFKHQLTGQVGAIRDLFLAVFFVGVGMSVDLSILATDAWRVVLGALAVLVTKGATIALIAWAAGTTRAVAVKVGCSLAQGGEFGLILIGLGAGSLGLLATDESTILTSVIVVSLILTPALISLGDRLAARATSTRLAPWIVSRALVDADTETEASEEDLRPLVVVAGFGVVGRAVVDRLCLEDIRVTVVEMNPKTVRTQQGLGRSVIFGDISDPEVMHAAGVPDARALVLTVPDDGASARATRQAKILAPDIRVIVRSQYVSQATMALEHGADHMVIEELATAAAMERLVEEIVIANPRE